VLDDCDALTLGIEAINPAITAPSPLPGIAVVKMYLFTGFEILSRVAASRRKNPVVDDFIAGREHSRAAGPAVNCEHLIASNEFLDCRDGFAGSQAHLHQRSRFSSVDSATCIDLVIDRDRAIIYGVPKGLPLRLEVKHPYLY